MLALLVFLTLLHQAFAQSCDETCAGGNYINMEMGDENKCLCSNNYPLNYVAGDECVVRFHSKNTDHIRLTVTEFELLPKEGKFCRKSDRMRFVDIANRVWMGTPENYFMKHVCNAATGDIIDLNSPEVLMKFQTRANSEGGKWRVCFTHPWNDNSIRATTCDGSTPYTVMPGETFGVHPLFFKDLSITDAVGYSVSCSISGHKDEHDLITARCLDDYSGSTTVTATFGDTTLPTVSCDGIDGWVGWEVLVSVNTKYGKDLTVTCTCDTHAVGCTLWNGNFIPPTTKFCLGYRDSVTGKGACELCKCKSTADTYRHFQTFSSWCGPVADCAPFEIHSRCPSDVCTTVDTKPCIQS